ncbi:HTH-type transcriptional activator AllS [Enhygromyxa salina]|uniref:HTH-type transcriptional activator AllS n=1 Tax=Enhygromyxa salina TaxID=215803 RepID=A0A2S9XBV7_9BACT|nr:LysR family transcriptional regulator [Enhygromyxa salina]PRP90339.1 HTH-type transcriptional activator AllS [Enhygromyxa salina]
MDLEETRAFLAVIDSGSFKAAAEKARQPRATLRRRVEALEARVGIALLERSRSGVTPTAAGELLAREGRVMLREQRALLAALREVGDDPSGDIRIGAPAGLGPHELAVLFGLFQAQFPRLRVHLRVCDGPVSELIEHVDIALCCGRDKPPGRWQTHPLMPLREGLRASRSYLQRHGVPETIEELADHKLLGWQAPSAAPRRWPTFDGGDLAVEPVLTTTDYNVLRRLASLGFGIALLPDAHLPDLDGEDEALIPVLDGVVGRSHELRALVPEMLADTPKIRALVEHLARFVAMLREPRRETPTGVGSSARWAHMSAHP